MKNIKDYDLEELKNELKQIGEKPFRAEQIFKWLYQDKVKEFDEMTDKFYKKEITGKISPGHLRSVRDRKICNKTIPIKKANAKVARTIIFRRVDSLDTPFINST